MYSYDGISPGYHQARSTVSRLNLPPPDQFFDRHWQLRHRTDDGVGSGRGKTFGQPIASVAGACESDGGHASSPGRLQEEIWSGLAACYLHGAEDIVPKHTRKTAHLERERETFGSR